VYGFTHLSRLNHQFRRMPHSESCSKSADWRRRQQQVARNDAKLVTTMTKVADMQLMKGLSNDCTHETCVRARRPARPLQRDNMTNPISYGEVELLQRKAEYSSTTSSRLQNVFSRSADARLFFEIDKSIQLLVDLRSRRSLTRRLRAALQFPDDLLGDARLVCGLLREAAAARNLDLDCFVLGCAAFVRRRVLTTSFGTGDTSYGSCCIDDVAAQHANVDFLIHYGRSCLSA
jgi:hypothetical protein